MKKQTLEDIEFSVLDLVPVTKGNTIATSFRNSIELAQKAEEWGFKRFWISEHHNMESIASSATVILISSIAGNTSKIRVGSGGIMLPNHSPLIVAEQFRTLETMFSGRIDLGLGRAPGTDGKTAMALRRNRQETVQDFPDNIKDIQRYFSAGNKDASVRAIPGEGLNIPIYLLGSSTFSAQLAGMMGLPYAFASHFAPAHLHAALHLYHQNFDPSQQLQKPYSIGCVNVIAADTDEEAQYLATSQKLFALGVIRGKRDPMPPPVKDMEEYWNDAEQAALQQMMQYTFVGSSETVEKKLTEFINETQVNEIMVVSHIYEHKARLRSYEILSDLKLDPKDPFSDHEN